MTICLANGHGEGGHRLGRHRPDHRLKNATKKEQELLSIGGEYRKAILRDYESSPGVNRCSSTLGLDWDLVRSYDVGIVGIRGQSDASRAVFKR